MKTYPSLGIDVLSGKLRPNARLWKLLLVISILAFLILPFTINKLLGDGIILKVLSGIIIVSLLICVTVFKYMDKYEVLGKLILDTKRIIIKDATGKKLINITYVMEIHLKYNGYWEQPYFGGRFMLTKPGNENFISIKQHDEERSFEIFISSGAMKNRILKYLEYYHAKGIKTIIQQI